MPFIKQFIALTDKFTVRLILCERAFAILNHDVGDGAVDFVIAEIHRFLSRGARSFNHFKWFY